MKHKKTAYFGSYGWSKGALKKMESMIEGLDWEMVDAFEFAGGAEKDEIRARGSELGKKFAEAVKKG